MTRVSLQPGHYHLGVPIHNQLVYLKSNFYINNPLPNSPQLCPKHRGVHKSHTFGRNKPGLWVPNDEPSSTCPIHYSAIKVNLQECRRWGLPRDIYYQKKKGESQASQILSIKSAIKTLIISVAKDKALSTTTLVGCYFTSKLLHYRQAKSDKLYKQL